MRNTIRNLLAITTGMSALSRIEPGAIDFSAPRVRKPCKTYAPNGERECARRLRQIAAGTLKASA